MFDRCRSFICWYSSLRPHGLFHLHFFVSTNVTCRCGNASSAEHCLPRSKRHSLWSVRSWGRREQQCPSLARWLTEKAAACSAAVLNLRSPWRASATDRASSYQRRGQTVRWMLSCPADRLTAWPPGHRRLGSCWRKQLEGTGALHAHIRQTSRLLLVGSFHSSGPSGCRL
jgi:hypothetical protein